MAKTYLDELIDYPAQAIQKIAENKECVAFILNKNIETITEEDFDDVLENHIFDYAYIDDTITEAGAFVWVEAEVPSVENKQIKNMRLYVTVACHKKYMDVNSGIIKGASGNRRDNLIRYIDKLLNSSDLFGIGKLSLKSAKTLSSTNQSFSIRELCYAIPDFNLRVID